MAATLPPNVIADAIRLIEAHDRVISSLSPEARNEYKARLERNDSPILEANTLSRLALELRKYGGAR